MTVLDTIREEFPQWSWAFNHPELGPILRKAVDPNAGFSANTLRAKIQATRWWKTQSAAQRNWVMLRKNDPEQAQAKRREGRRILSERATQLGIKLNSRQAAFISEVMNSKGLSPDDPAITQALYNIYKRAGQQRGPGAITTARQQARSIARRDFFVPLSRQEEVNWGINIATGRMTADDLRQQMSARAASRYKHVEGLADALKKGSTMRELFDGHIQTIAETLELDPDSIDLTKGYFNKVIDTVGADGVHRSLSLGDTATLARRDKRYWNTKEGQASSSGLTNFLFKEFGVR